MALIKGNVVVIGSKEEAIPAPCEYCGKVDELRPYGKNGAFICFECGMKPENKETTIKKYLSLLDSVPKIDPNKN